MEEGAEGLMKERRGRACHVSGTRTDRPHKLDKYVKRSFLLTKKEFRVILNNGLIM